MLDVVDLLKGINFEEKSDQYAERTKAVKRVRIINDRTISLVKNIRYFMNSAVDVPESAGASLTAPTRGGKTTIVRVFRQVFEEKYMASGHTTESSDEMPIVYVEVPSSATTKSLGQVTLQSMRDAAPDHGDGSYKKLQIIRNIERLKVKLVIFDEMQRLVEHDQGKVAYKVSEWLQELINRTNGSCCFLFVGTTRSRRVFENNGHLVGRSDQHYKLNPYRREKESPKDWEFYKSYLAHFDSELSKHAGFDLSGLFNTDLALRIHAASLGYPGATAKLIQAAAVDAMMEFGRNVIDRDSFSTAFERIWEYSKVKRVNPFLVGRPPVPELVWPQPWEDTLD